MVLVLLDQENNSSHTCWKYSAFHIKTKPDLQKLSPKLHDLSVLRNSLIMPHGDIYSGN